MDTSTASSYTAKLIDGPLEGKTVATAFLDTGEESEPPELAIHVVLDTAAPHKTRIVHGWLVKRPRFHLHFTPTSASWLNLVECWFAVLTRRRLTRGVVTSAHER